MANIAETPAWLGLINPMNSKGLTKNYHHQNFRFQETVLNQFFHITLSEATNFQKYGVYGSIYQNYRYSNCQIKQFALLVPPISKTTSVCEIRSQIRGR